MEASKQTSNTVRLSSGNSVRPSVLGGDISKLKPAVTPDCSRAFVACGNLAVGFSTRTCRRVGTLGPLRGTVTATCGGPPENTSADSLQAVATGSSFGELDIWDVKSMQRINHLQFDSPVLHIVWPSKSVMVVFLGQRGEAGGAELIHFSSPEKVKSTETTPLRVTNAGPADSTDDVLAVADGKDLVIWCEGWSACQRYPHSHQLTSVSVDGSRRCISAGDSEGVLWTWWGLLHREGVDASKAAPARWHWHADAILCLERCGPVLLSAGREGVICVRNLEDETLHFIPRFPTALRHMTASYDGQVVCSMEDNSLAVVSSIHGWVRPQYIYSVDLPDVAPAPNRRVRKRKRVGGQDVGNRPKKQNMKSRIFHNLAGCEIGISSGRRVQFLPPGETQLGKATKLSHGGSANSDPKQRWALQQLVFSTDASCLMTCETRLSPALENFDPHSAFSCILKWWRRTDTGQYILDSVSNNPHAADVTVAIANPDHPDVFATASEDGNYKLWDRLRVEEAEQEGAEPLRCWQCLAMGSWRRQPIHAGCFSPDGSLLAMGATGSVVLWAAAEGEAVEILDLEKASDKPTRLCSVVADGMFMLIACVTGKGKDEILCWDLESLEVFVRLDLGAALPGRGCCEMRCSLPPGGPVDIMAFRPGEATVMTWRLSAEKQEVQESPKKKRKAAESSPNSKRPRVDASMSLPLPPTMKFVEQGSATLPKQHALLDATFRMQHDGGSSVICCTSSLELWDIDLSGADAVVEKESVTQPEEEPLPRNTGPLASMTSGRAAVEPSRPGFALPRRTTPAQQAGLVPRLVHRVVPPHVPSHLLPNPAALWAEFLSVFAKPPDAVQPTAAFSVKAAADLPPKAEAEDLASWAEPLGQVPEEFVDAAFMDALVAGTAH